MDSLSMTADTAMTQLPHTVTLPLSGSLHSTAFRALGLIFQAGGNSVDGLMEGILIKS